MSKTIYIDGLEIEISKKRIKRVNMRIKEPDGRIVISAPYGTPDSFIANFVRSKRSWIDKNVARTIEKAEAHPAPKDKVEKEARRRELKKRIEERLPYIEEVTGLKCSGWTVRDMKSRWGSCNISTHHLNFSLMLATRTDEELDYVILHELVHTIVPGHGADFYAIMDRHMPEWKSRTQKIEKWMYHN